MQFVMHLNVSKSHYNTWCGHSDAPEHTCLPFKSSPFFILLYTLKKTAIADLKNVTMT